MSLLLWTLILSQDARVKELLRKGDEFWAKREEKGRIEASVETYQKALALDEACVAACWRIARSYLWIGRHESDGEKKCKVYRDGIEYCKMAISLDADSIEAHFWLGVMYGLFGEAKGVMQSLYLIDPIKQEIEWVLKKDEKHEYAGPHRVLGRFYHKVPGVKGGDNRKAIRHLLRAIELAPDLHDNYLFLAEVYVDEGRKDDAKQALRKCLDTPDNAVWGPESRETKKQARELLQKLG